MSDQTFISFRDKWRANPRLGFDETLRETSDTFQWILRRNGFGGPRELSEFLGRMKRVLDAGCGNGRVTAMLRKYAGEFSEIVGVDLSADVARSNFASDPRVTIRECDLLGDLSDLGKFDFIYCQEVLHHTADPVRAFRNLCTRLNPGGEIAVYVYKKKAPLREFADDYVRDRISGLTYEKAMTTCAQITALGKALSELHVKVTVPSVDMLGIQAGEYDIQRFLYHHFLKCYWNPDVSFNDNSVVNYDWYHPQTCFRHTPEEVLDWFASCGLEVLHSCIDEYGITIRGRSGETGDGKTIAGE